jgi:tetratricopeptide (TPR) repeat protein
MCIRTINILLLAGIVFLGTATAEEGLMKLLNSGNQAFGNAKFDEAERYYREAADLAEGRGDAAGRAEALGDLGIVALTRGHYGESQRYLLQALEVLRKTGTKHYLPVVLNNLGDISAQSLHFAQAEAYYKEALRVLQDANPRDVYASRIHNNLGVLYFTLGEDGRAEKAFRNAIAVIEKESGRDSTELVPPLSNLGGLYVSQKNWKDATAVFDRALLILRRPWGSSQLQVATLLEQIGLMHQARAHFSEAARCFARCINSVLGCSAPHTLRSATGH